MPFVTVPDGVRLYYEEVGPLLLTGGLGWDDRFWI
jgi:hypothetical protein